MSIQVNHSNAKDCYFLEDQKKKSSSAKGEDTQSQSKKEIEDLLKQYQHQKAKMWHTLLGAISSMHQEIGEQLKNSPFIEQVMASQNEEKEASASKHEIQNFFMILYKFLGQHAEQQSKIEVVNAESVDGKMHLLRTASLGAEKSLNEMKHQIHKVYKAKKKAKKMKGLTLGIEIVIGVVILAVTIAVSVLSDGAGAPSAIQGGVEADAAINAAIDGAVSGSTAATESMTAVSTEVGTEAGMSAAASAEESAQSAEAAATLAEQSADTAEQTASLVSPEVSGEGEAAGTEGGEEAAESAKTARAAATQARTIANAARASANAAKAYQAGEISADEAESVISTSMDTVEEASSEIDEVSEGMTNSLKGENIFQKAANLFKAEGMTKNTAMAGFKCASRVLTPVLMTVGASTSTNSIMTTKENEDASTATLAANTKESASIAISEASQQGLQVDVQSATQRAQNALEEEKADKAQVLNLLKAQASVFTIGQSAV